jgi:alpha-2-macroglobulin
VFERDPVVGLSAVVLRDSTGREQVRTQRWASSTASASVTAPGSAAALQSIAVIGEAMQLDWPTDRKDAMLAISHDGSGRPWATVQTLAALELKQPMNAGFRLERSIVPVTSRVAGQYSRGDVVRIKLRITPAGPANWVVVNDPIPAGATILGSGLGRDSQIDANRPDAAQSNVISANVSASSVPQGGWNNYRGAWPAYEERAFDGYRGYYSFVSNHPFEVQYTVRLNNPGQFKLPPSRVEAMYNPEMYGMVPIAPITVAQ